MRRLGGGALIVERGERVLKREPAPLGEALADVFRRDGIELVLGVATNAARRDGDEFVLELEDGRELRGDKLLVATGRRPRVADIGLETVGIAPDPHGVPVDARMGAGDRLWAIGDVVGIFPLTHVGKYQGEVVAANILDEPREANYDAVPRVTYTDPQAGAGVRRRHASAAPPAWPRWLRPPPIRTRTPGPTASLTLLGDGERLTGAYALGPEAGEWLQQATRAIRARVPLEVLSDTMQPFPTFSEIAVEAPKALRHEITAALESVST